MTNALASNSPGDNAYNQFPRSGFLHMGNRTVSAVRTGSCASFNRPTSF